MELQRVCDKYLFSECDVVADCEGKISVKGFIDVPDFEFQARTKKWLIGRNVLLNK